MGRLTEELVLAFLREEDGEPVLGETLASKLGLPASAIYRAIETLRQIGHRIEGLPGKGYCLAELPDPYLSLDIEPHLRTRELGWTIHRHQVLASTNEKAKELAREGATHGEVVIADRQTGGKGRRGRAWLSPPRANLYLSVVLRPELPPRRAPELTSAAAVAVAEALAGLGLRAGVKWPNDIELGGRKVGGILTELVADAQRIHFVILGIGLNLNMLPSDFPEELRPLATSVRTELGRPVPRAAVAAELLEALERWIDRLVEEGFGPVRERLLELSTVLGRRVRMLEAERTIEGEVVDIDDGGALCLRLENGDIERFLSGDLVSLRRT